MNSTTSVTGSIRRSETDVLGGRRVSLDANEVLFALAVSSATKGAAKNAADKLEAHRGCEFHKTHVPTPSGEAGLRKLGLNVTSDSVFAIESLFVN